MRTLLLLPFALLGCGAAQQPQPQQPVQQAPAAVPMQTYRIVNTYPHDPKAFTQGLFWVDGQLWESTGHVGQSTVRRVDLKTGKVLQSTPIPAGQFGEGSVNWGKEIISLTWQGQIGYRWDRKTLKKLGEWRYTGEGWGLTQNGRDIIMSDGSAQLRFLDPKNMTERRRVTVTFDGQPVHMLNELEWVDGAILANVWMRSAILRIDPASGKVTGVIDLSDLARDNQTSGDNVLNGIAWDAKKRRLFVTGKYWPRLYEIQLTSAPR